MSSQKPFVAIVILSWNGRNYLKEYLPSVLKTEYSNYGVYVADNDSTDGTTEWLPKAFPEVKLIQTGYNAGFAEGYNIALKKIEADYYVLLNQDVAVDSRWLDTLVQKAESDNKIAACQPKILAYKKQSHFEYAGAAGGFIDRWGYPFCRGRIFDYNEADIGQYNSETEIAWGSGACLFIRANIYHELGGLDKDFFAHMEEIDLCWRVKNAGYRLYCCPDSVVYHLGGGSLNYGNPRKTFLNFRNNLRMIAKNAPKQNWKSTLVIRLFLDQLSAFNYLISGHLGDFKAVWKAHYSFLSELRKWIQRRQEIWQMLSEQGNKKPNKAGFYKKSIVFQYFAMKKKKFSDLQKDDFY
ncbi:MAG: glycosyltransferase family 2 protein [Chitinophagales bacterium]